MIFIGLMLMLVMQVTLLGQTRRPREIRKAQASPEEIVSMSRRMPFREALKILNILSKRFLGKLIVDPQNRETPIGIDIQQQHWRDALEMILRTNNLWYKERPDYFQITSPTKPRAESEDPNYVDFSTREVVISAIFFEANASRLRQMGMSWDFFRGNDVNTSVRMSAAGSKSGVFEIETNPALDFGDLVSTFKALESDQVGEVVASPQITVRSREEGRIQVGSDIAVTIKDFAGNSVTQFFSTGSIIMVRPEIIQHDTLNFIHLNLTIERSNTASNASGLEIKKSSAKTSVLLLDGEETIIGGLYMNEEAKSREGVPLLKNLPWWFFGLRYVFGFDAKSMIKKELVILLKAELVPSLAERVRRKMQRTKNYPILLKQRLENKKELEYLKKQNKQFK